MKIGVSPPPHHDSKMPDELQDQLDEFETWAINNKNDARMDTFAFWMLKVPAILASASAGVWAQFNWTTVSVISGAIASLCVIIDGIHPRGMLRNTHLCAYHDIRNLTLHMMSEWRSRATNTNHDNVARKIISEVEPERQRIAEYVRNAETALKFEDKTT